MSLSCSLDIEEKILYFLLFCHSRFLCLSLPDCCLPSIQKPCLLCLYCFLNLYLVKPWYHFLVGPFLIELVVILGCLFDHTFKEYFSQVDNFPENLVKTWFIRKQVSLPYHFQVVVSDNHSCLLIVDNLEYN